MREDQFSSRSDVFADCGSVDVSLETSPAGSRDANMESDVLRRRRWRKPFTYLTGIFSNSSTMSIERIVSVVMTDHVLQEEYDSGFSIDEYVTYQASAALSTEVSGLIDSGANGGLANPREMKLMNYMMSDEEMDNYHAVGRPLTTATHHLSIVRPL